MVGGEGTTWESFAPNCYSLSFSPSSFAFQSASQDKVKLRDRSLHIQCPKTLLAENFAKKWVWGKMEKFIRIMQNKVKEKIRGKVRKEKEEEKIRKKLGKMPGKKVGKF